MIIKSLKLTNFRSHKEYILNCTKKTSLILGENGSGKTSVLEAIYICLCGKSFRATDPDILKRDTDFYRVELEYMDGQKTIVVYDQKSKKFLIEDKKTKRLPRKNKYPVVLFLPDDLHLISASPASKREYFDRVISGMNESYSSLISRYEKALRQRNEILKTMTEQVESDEIFSWNILLAKYGTEIRRIRQSFIKELNTELTDKYRSIAENKDEIRINYVPQDNEETENEYLERLISDTRKDIYLGHTSYGAHRDGYEFIFNNQDANGSASRGEVRSIVLAMKFIEASLIYRKTSRRPVVLLDDVFSELDEKRQTALVKNFKENQVIITSVEGV